MHCFLWVVYYAVYLNHISPSTPSPDPGTAVLTNFAAPPHLGTLAEAILATTQAVVATVVVLLLSAGLGAVTNPMNVGEVLGANVSVISLTQLVVGIDKSSLLPAGACVSAATPVNVGLLIGAAPLMSPTANTTVPVSPFTLSTGERVATNAVVAILVLLSPSTGVGAVGVPVSAGLANGA
jgi:hypothetical protein